MKEKSGDWDENTKGHKGPRGDTKEDRWEKGRMWGAAPRPVRAKFALHPRHVRRTCLDGTHQAMR